VGAAGPPHMYGTETKSTGAKLQQEASRVAHSRGVGAPAPTANAPPNRARQAEAALAGRHMTCCQAAAHAPVGAAGPPHMYGTETKSTGAKLQQEASRVAHSRVVGAPAPTANVPALCGPHKQRNGTVRASGHGGCAQRNTSVNNTSC
jgi:hypothetical protein